MELTLISAKDYAQQLLNNTLLNPDDWHISDLWRRGNFSLLYADDRIEASGAAFAMAATVPAKAKILFVSFSQNLQNIKYQLSDSQNVMLLIPSHSSENDLADAIIENLHEAITKESYDTIIIDNINRISALSHGKNSALTQLVHNFYNFHSEHDLSILLVAHNLSKSTRFRLSAYTDTSFSAGDVESKGIYRRKGTILLNAIKEQKAIKDFGAHSHNNNNLNLNNSITNSDCDNRTDLHHGKEDTVISNDDYGYTDNSDTASEKPASSESQVPSFEPRVSNSRSQVPSPKFHDSACDYDYSAYYGSNPESMQNLTRQQRRAMQRVWDKDNKNYYDRIKSSK